MIGDSGLDQPELRDLRKRHNCAKTTLVAKTTSVASTTLACESCNRSGSQDSAAAVHCARKLNSSLVHFLLSGQLHSQSLASQSWTLPSFVHFIVSRRRDHPSRANQSLGLPSLCIRDRLIVVPTVNNGACCMVETWSHIRTSTLVTSKLYH